jgi:2-succinyl-6-hydroxy-2,4-cyclohexadiene-1-carboxylate synthase
MPVLLVAGKSDAKYSEIADTMGKKIRGSAVAKVEGSGHCVHVERPEEFADLVERFLAGRPEMLRAAK